MTRKSLELRIAELDARKKSLVARQRKEERKKDTRRKILIGSLMLNRIEEEAEEAFRLRAWLAKELPGFLTRGIDLKLFRDIIPADAEGDASENKDGDAEA